jgi:hypothetical protein
MKREKVYSHAFHAARTPGFLDSVATLSAAVEAGKLKLTVTNRRAGHSLPGGGGGMRVIALSVSFYGASGESLGTTDVQTYGIRYADAQGVTPVPKWLARTVAHRAEIPSDGAVTESCALPAKARRAEARLVYYSIDPAYVPSLVARHVDLSARPPIVMARASAKVP